MNEPIPFDPTRRRRDISTAPTPELYSAILSRLAALGDEINGLSAEIDGIAAFVVELAAKENRRPG